MKTANELFADLKELGCPVRFVFMETPTEHPKPSNAALEEIHEWLMKKKKVIVKGLYIMFADDSNKLSYVIYMNRRAVYYPPRRWSIEQKYDCLYDGIRKAVKLLKEK